MEIMAKKMLIDATHAEETRVVVVEGNKVEEFDFESDNRRQLAGNIYLAKVTRIEPSLQAAFIDYGGNRHGFLAFSEIHPDYYQIPIADREALMEEERAYSEAMRRKDDDEAVGKIDESDISKKENEKSTLESPKALDTSGSIEDNNKVDVGEGVDETIEVKSKLSGNKRKTVQKKKAEKNKTSKEDTQSVEIKEEKKRRGRPKKSINPIAANIETETNDELISSDDLESQVSDEKSGLEVADSKGSGRTKRRYNRRARKKSDNTLEKDPRSSEKDSRVEIKEKEEGGAGVELKKEIESVSEIDDDLDIRRIRKPRQRRYKIQEVIKVRQIMLVQVVKEERGNKGAALTTYLSLAGRYCVLMPNTARGGGISRKITNLSDRKKLKEIANEIDVPVGAGLIVRTAGAKRTKTEIKRDYEYLQRLWEQIRELTLKSIAPNKIYEEGDLIKRSIRDLYNRDIDEVLVEGERGYRNAKDFMKMIMPSHAKNVKHYHDGLPLFARYQVESFLSAMFNPVVQLKSGGYIVIGITEALVAIDVNSGRATKEGSIEDTALKTNLEAADEISRQLRLRDLAGLIVIDFIDMDERKNNASVERKIKDRLKSDRARIQLGRISGFGLLEMSRQRLRPGMLEATTQSCPSCHGTGLIRSDDNLALSILRQIEEEGVRKRSQEVVVKCPVSVANFIMNQKRDYVASIERNYLLSVRVEGDINLVSPEYSIEKLKSATRILTEEEPELVTADGIMDIPEEEINEIPKDEDEKPKKNRRRRRRRKKYLINEEDEEANQEETEEVNSLEQDTTENSSPNKKNISSQNSENKTNRQERKKSNKDSLTGASIPDSSQEIVNLEDSDPSRAKADPKTTAAKAIEENNATNDRNESLGQKKKSSKKSVKNEVLGSDDEGDDENSKQKRRGWWSLKT